MHRRARSTVLSLCVVTLSLGLAACGTDPTQPSPADGPTLSDDKADGGHAASSSSSYSVRSFVVCAGCPTQTGGINNEGLVGASSPSQGYVYDSRSDAITAVPGAIATTVPNDRGQVPGITVDPSGAIVPLVRERDGTTRVLPAYPGALVTAVLVLRPDGTAVGYATTDFVTFFSFMRARDGTYTPLLYPGSAGSALPNTALLGWNAPGVMVGYRGDPTFTHFVGAIRDKDGAWRPFTIPGASSTMIFAVNASGVLVGGYSDGTTWHGFVWDRGAWQTVDAPGAANTTVTGINDRGVLVGETFGAGSPITGVPGAAFVATPSSAR